MIFKAKKNKKLAESILAVALLVSLSSLRPSFASHKDPNSPLTNSQQTQANRGNSYAKSGREEKAQVAYQGAIDQAVSVEQCLALIKNTEHYGHILIPVRRNCLNRALHLAKTDDDYFQIIASARQCQLYEITKEAIDSLIARANTKDQLLTLAHKAQSMALNDVAHVAMEKLYRQLESTEDRLAFAKQAKLMAMEDLMRQAIKDMLDHEMSTHGLCALLPAIEPLEQPDLERKILRKAVYQVASVDDCKEVYEAARRLGQQDVIDLAAFKGRKMILINKAKAEQQALEEQEAEAQMSADERAEYEAKKAEAAAAAEANRNQGNQPNKNTPTPPSGPGF